MDKENAVGEEKYVSQDLIRSVASKAAVLMRSVASELQQLAV